MCVHAFYIFSTCGHSNFGQEPLRLCKPVEAAKEGKSSTSCIKTPHPYRSYKLDCLCPPCEHNRSVLMTRIKDLQKVDYNECQWKVSYGLGNDGKDFWGRKMEQLAEEEAARKVEERKMRKKRFSRRSKGKGSLKSADS